MPTSTIRRLVGVAMLFVLAAPAVLAGLPTIPLPPLASGQRHVALPRGAPMADTVLARVGDHRIVTVAGFHRDWARVKPPARPDSLTPQGARQFLDLLIGKEALAERALRERWVWTARESAEYRELTDRLTLQAALEEAVGAERQRRIAARDTALDRESLGLGARDRAVAELGTRFDTVMVARLARAFAAIPRPSRDSSIWSQIRAMGTNPVVAPADTGRVLATTRGGPFRVSELLGAWARLNPLLRPRIESGNQVMDLARNGIFERELRAEVARRGLVRRPDIAGALAEKREYFAVSHYVDREVGAEIPTDSLTLTAFYRRTIRDWDLPRRALVTRIVSPDRAGAGRTGARLRDPAQAESLIAGGRRAGVNYQVEISERSDSTLYVAAAKAGAGAVLGPDSVSGGWLVARVDELRPGRTRSFSEVRDLVEHRWTAEEGERRVVALIERAKRGTRTVLNQRAIDRLSERRDGNASPGEHHGADRTPDPRSHP